MTDNIQISVRMRPLISRELEKKASVHWSSENSTSIYQISCPSVIFNYDRVFDGDESNEIVYSEFCSPIVRCALNGINGTIFAYGQTASGKTFTMMGKDDGETHGIVHFAIFDIFNDINKTVDREFLLRVSYMEVYNEIVSDLLCENSDNLKLQDDEFGNLTVCGLTEHIVENADQILSLMQRGGKNRRTGTTCMNQKSSRSHSIFRIVIESRPKNIKNAPVNVSQLDLVDLAGSERACHTKVTGKRFRESININVSLLMLSHVINQLNENESYISYRDSKLTRILQNSLGGNSKTAIICTVTPASLEETLSTLKFASRAKCVKNNPKVNEILNEQALMKAYENKIKKLTEELEAIKEANKAQAEGTSHIQDVKNIPFSLFASRIENKTQRRMTWGGSSNIHSSEIACKISHDWLKYIEILTMEEIKNSLLSKDQDEGSYMKLFPGVKSCIVPKTLIHASTQTNICDTDGLLENTVFLNTVSPSRSNDKMTSIVPKPSCYATLGAYDDIVNVSPLHGDRIKSEFYSMNQKKMLTFIECNIKQNKSLNIVQCENIIKYVQKVLHLFSMEKNYEKNAILETVLFSKEFWFFIVLLKSFFPELLNNSMLFFHKNISEFLENNVPELLLNNFIVSRIDILTELKYFNSKEMVDKKFAKANRSKIQDKLKRIFSHSCYDDLEVNDSFIHLNLMPSANNQAISTAINSFDLNKCIAIKDFYECQSCITNDETIKKLQEQIQLQQDTISHLMYQCDLRNKQISILKEKEQIKDQIILSLQDEIALRNDENKGIYKLNIDNLKEPIIDELKENFSHTDKLNMNDGAIFQPMAKKESSCSISLQCCRCENNYSSCKMECCVEKNYTRTKFDALELKLDNMYTVNNKQNIIVPKRNYSSVCDRVLMRTPETNDITLKDIWNEIYSPSKRCIVKKFVSDAIISQEENLLLQTNDFDFLKINEHFRKLITVNDDDDIDSNDVISLRKEMSHLRTIFFRLIGKNTQNAVLMNKENSGLGLTKHISFYNNYFSDFNVLQEVLLRVDYFLKNLQKSASVNKGLKQAAEEAILFKNELLDLEKKLQEKDTQLFNVNKNLLDLKKSIILLKYICQSSKCGKPKILNYRKYAKNVSLKARHLNPIRTIKQLHKMVSELFPFFEKQVSYLSVISTELAETEARLLSSFNDLTLDTILNDNSCSDSTSSSINDKKVLQMKTVDLVSSKDSDTERRNLRSMISNIKSNIVKVSKASSHIEKLFECIKSSYRSKIKNLELMHEADKLKWNTKVMEQIEKLEEKYEQEIADQENEFFDIMNTKLNDMKQKFYLAEKENEQQFKNQMDKIQKEYSEKISALKEEHCKNISDLEKKLYKEIEDKKEIQDKLNKSQKSEIMVLKLSNKLKDLKKEKENIQKLNNCFKQKIKSQLVEIEKLKTQLNEYNKKCFNHDTNSLSSSEKENNSKDQFNKLQTSEIQNNQPAVSTGNLCFETDNLTKKLKYELDQKKAKIISLETNNTSMVKEIMMLKNRIKSIQQYQCGCSQNLKGSEIPVPSKEGYYSEKEKHPAGMNKKTDKQKEVPKLAEMRYNSSEDANQCKKQKNECDAKTKQSAAKDAEVVLDEIGELQCKQQ